MITDVPVDRPELHVVVSEATVNGKVIQMPYCQYWMPVVINVTSTIPEKHCHQQTVVIKLVADGQVKECWRLDGACLT